MKNAIHESTLVDIGVILYIKVLWWILVKNAIHKSTLVDIWGNTVHKSTLVDIGPIGGNIMQSLLSGASARRTHWECGNSQNLLLLILLFCKHCGGCSTAF